MALTTTPEELDALAKRIIEVDEETQGTLRNVRSAVDTVGASWKGNAATAFNNLMQRYEEDARKVSEALRTIAEQIASSSQVYARNEEEQQGNLGGIAGRLG